MDTTSVQEIVRQYVGLKDHVDLIVKRQNEVKQRLVAVIDSDGVTDERGHISFPINDDSTGIKAITKQRRVSKSLDIDAAEDILAKKGLKDLCIKMMPMLDEDAIMAAFYEGRLTEEDIDTMFPAKVSYAFILEKK
jgi:hypothetical protein